LSFYSKLLITTQVKGVDNLNCTLWQLVFGKAIDNALQDLGSESRQKDAE